MDGKTININEYKTRLMEIKVEAEQEVDASKRNIIIDLIDWLSKKIEEWHQQRTEYENAFDESQQYNNPDIQINPYENQCQLMENYLNHLKEAGAYFIFIGR